MEKWQFPNCLGAIDGRHMRIRAPPNLGSAFYNYKQFFSIVLLATCDADYKFTWIDVGQYGSISDGGIWANTDFAQDLENGTVDLPTHKALPGKDFLFYMYSTKGGLTEDMRVFNYRLSRCRRTIENTFGILTTRWQILQKALCMSVENSEMLIKAIVCLHNFIMIGEEKLLAHERRYYPQNYFDREDYTVREGDWKQQYSAYFKEISRVGANRAGAVAIGLREYLRNYFVSDIGKSQAPWQYEAALGTTHINLPARLNNDDD